MKKLLFLILFLITLAYGVSATWCYQETANVSTGCGGLNTGVYACTGSWHAIQTCALTYDGDWDTYGDSAVGQVTYIYINYTKPTVHNVTNATWRTKIGQEGTVNNTLGADCWNRTTVEFKIESDHDFPSVDGYCYNGSTWRTIASDLADPYIYEEGMNWDLTASDSCSYISGNWNIDAADACSLSSTTNLNQNNLLIDGTGTVSLTGTIHNATTITVQGAILHIQGGTLKTGE